MQSGSLVPTYDLYVYHLVPTYDLYVYHLVPTYDLYVYHHLSYLPANGRRKNVLVSCMILLDTAVNHLVTSENIIMHNTYIHIYTSLQHIILCDEFQGVCMHSFWIIDIHDCYLY